MDECCPEREREEGKRGRRVLKLFLENHNFIHWNVSVKDVIPDALWSILQCYTYIY